MNTFVGLGIIQERHVKSADMEPLRQMPAHGLDNVKGNAGVTVLDRVDERNRQAPRSRCR